MADLGLRLKMIVRETMSSPVITVDQDTSVYLTAQLMADNHIGCIVVTSKKVEPLGIITETDLVDRVLAKNIQPSELTAKEVMTSPLITIDPDEALSEAARRMSRLNVRRFGVMYKGKLVGIISSKDILDVTPELINIFQEKARIEGVTTVEEGPKSAPLTGNCDHCDRWSNNLTEVEGNFLCEECQIELKGEY